MKRIKGGTKIVRGQLLENSYSATQNRIILFDGKFTTGYKVVKFTIAPEDPLTSKEIMSTLSTEPDSGIRDWDWNDVKQFAWAGWGFNSSTFTEPYELIDRDNVVVQDLWINAATTGEAGNLNYYIELEKYEFTAWDGAATLVRNQSQAGPE